MSKLNIRNFALSCAIAWSLILLILGAVSTFLGWGSAMVMLLSSVYLGYAPTPWGILMGVLWGFVDAVIIGTAFAWMCNHFVKN
jgi:hypothetical protein